MKSAWIVPTLCAISLGFASASCKDRGGSNSYGDNPNPIENSLDASADTFHLIRTFGMNECDQFDRKYAKAIAETTPDVLDLIQTGPCPVEIGVFWTKKLTDDIAPKVAAKPIAEASDLEDFGGGYEMAKKVGICKRDGFVTHFYESSVQNGEVEAMTENGAKAVCGGSGFTSANYGGKGFVGSL